MSKRKLRLLLGLVLRTVSGAVGKVVAKIRHEQQIDRMLARAHERAADDGTLTGKRVLVTGSTRGIGRALAEAFAARGAVVVVHGRSASEAAAVAADLTTSDGTTQVGLGADLAETGSGTDLVERAVAALGGIDVVVNNAGIHDPTLKPITDTSGAELEASLRINLVAAFEISSAALARMIEAGTPGRLITMSTMAAKPDHVNGTGIASYGISKIGLEGLAQYLAVEAEPHGVTVSTVRPGMIDTDMLAPIFSLEHRLRMLPASSVAPAVLHVATAPHDEVHGRMFDQQELLEQLGGTPD